MKHWATGYGQIQTRMQFGFAVALGLIAMSTFGMAEERQITFSPKNHNLDNNDNFSVDGRFLCYDTREMIGPGIDNSLSVEKVEIATGIETVLYAPPAVTGEKCAPGIAAASFSPVADKVAFIHGPPLDQVSTRGYYGKPNRNGAEVAGDGSGKMEWLDYRDVDKSKPTPPGAHRGGTHRHEYTLDGKRIGFTYDDFLLPQYDRNIGFMEPRADAPGGATHYFALLVATVPKDTAKPGELEKCYSDSWIGKRGLMRAFIGKVRTPNGVDYLESLFVVDIPANVDITTANSGDGTHYPTPPKGLRIRRLTQTTAEGVVRGTITGDRIAYYAPAADGTNQIFIIASDGSDQDPDPAKRPIQVTHFPLGAGGPAPAPAGSPTPKSPIFNWIRWHPSGNFIACIYNGGIAVANVQTGPRFGETTFVTPQNDGPPRGELVWSQDGKTFAYVRAVPTFDADGKPVKTYSGKDCQQIFIASAIGL